MDSIKGINKDCWCIQGWSTRKSHYQCQIWRSRVNKHTYSLLVSWDSGKGAAVQECCYKEAVLPKPLCSRKGEEGVNAPFSLSSYVLCLAGAFQLKIGKTQRSKGLNGTVLRGKCPIPTSRYKTEHRRSIVNLGSSREHLRSSFLLTLYYNNFFK